MVLNLSANIHQIIRVGKQLPLFREFAAGGWLIAAMYVQAGLGVALCLFAVIVRFRLARRKRGAPRLLFVLFLALAV